MSTNSHRKLLKYAYECLRFFVFSFSKGWRDSYQFELEIMKYVENIMEGCPPSHIRNNGQVPTISLYFLCKCHIGNDGDLLTISCHFLKDMMEGCPP